MSLTKYIRAACAWCGRALQGKGWFCSYKCDEFEFASRVATSKALREAGTPLVRK